MLFGAITSKRHGRGSNFAEDVAELLGAPGCWFRTVQGLENVADIFPDSNRQILREPRIKTLPVAVEFDSTAAASDLRALGEAFWLEAWPAQLPLHPAMAPRQQIPVEE